MKKILVAIAGFAAIAAMALMASAQTADERPPGFEEAAMLQAFEAAPAALAVVDYSYIQLAAQEGFYSFFARPKNESKKGAQKELASLRQLFGLMAFGQWYCKAGLAPRGQLNFEGSGESALNCTLHEPKDEPTG